MKPNKINILGTDYSVTYVDKPSDVDLYHRESLWGQIDFWTRSIRIYDDGRRADNEIFENILHEILHGVADALKLQAFDEKVNNRGHDELQLVAMALTDIFFRNGWMKK